MDDLIERLRDEVVLERFPSRTVIIDGKETVCDGGTVVQARNPDGREAADRIQSLEAERDRLAAIIREAEWIVEHTGYPVVAEEMRRALLPQQKEIGDGQG